MAECFLHHCRLNEAINPIVVKIPPSKQKMVRKSLTFLVWELRMSAPTFVPIHLVDVGIFHWVSERSENFILNTSNYLLRSADINTHTYPKKDSLSS